jgi:hypothetical protein
MDMPEVSVHSISEFLSFFRINKSAVLHLGKSGLLVDSNLTVKSVRFDKTLTVFGQFAVSHTCVVIAALQKSCGSDTMRAF